MKAYFIRDYDTKWKYQVESKRIYQVGKTTARGIQLDYHAHHYFANSIFSTAPSIEICRYDMVGPFWYVYSCYPLRVYFDNATWGAIPFAALHALESDNTRYARQNKVNFNSIHQS